MRDNEPCSICEEYIDGVICDKDRCPVGIMKKENKRLKAEIRNTDNHLVSLDRPLIEVKIEAYKEFAEKLYEKAEIVIRKDVEGEPIDRLIYLNDIDNVYKELMEGK